MVEKKYYLFLGIAVTILLFASFSAQAQLTTNNALSPSQLVQNILLGSGVTASNITYNGAAIALGEFNGSASNIGLAAGVIMSSGDISNAIGPNNTSGASEYNGFPGDPDLDQILAPTLSYDASILEFDFIPTSDTVKFRYVFGSEEYMEYVSSTPGGINDGFGFFISGPGITGSFTNNAKNIALIPGTILPVTMFNLNLNKNSVYYFDNGNGWGGGTAPDGATVQYDGFTVPLTAVAIVQCGQVYHIKLAIADGGDSSLDSGVFLEAGSFASSGTPDVGPDITVNLGCVRQITTINYNATTVAWNSVYPGALGEYNSYLSCTSECLNPTVTPLAGAPPYVDYQICGVSASCNPTTSCDTVRVTFNPELNLAVAPLNPVLCIGQNSTTITANGIGGTPPYNYLWNNVNPSQSINVGNGTYTVGLTDASGCPPIYSTVTVTSYSVPVTANAGADQTVCKQNPITTLNGTVTGANGGSWSGGAGVFSPNNTGLSGLTYAPTAAELAAGFVDLTLTTTGNGSCSDASDVVRINYEEFTEAVSFTVLPVSCFGGNNGSATASVAGGSTPPYSYSWNTVPSQSTATATNLSLGTYSVTITNGKGCTTKDSVAITQPSPVALASSITQVLCSGGNNGSITLNVIGGTSPYMYSWNNGATTAQISALTAQNYSVTVTDANTCTVISSFDILEPSPLVISLSPTDVNCFSGTDGAVSSIVSGGIAPYSYNWSSGTSSPDASGLQSGTFTLTVTDFNQCVSTEVVTVNQPLSGLLVNTASTNVSCDGYSNGSATAIASGGSPGYSYLWQPGALTTNSISNQPAGTYSLTLTDLKGCNATAFAYITEPPPITIDFINQVNVSCFAGNSGAVEVNPSGGTPAYTYSWSNGAITSKILNLISQTYTVTVTDDEGCIATSTIAITEPPAPLSVAVASIDATCYGEASGAVSSSASGGTMPYAYTWIPGGFTTQNVPGLPAGSYTVTVEDTLGCFATGSVVINQAAELILVTSSINADCGVANGETSVSVTGGSSPYTYQWAPSGGTGPVAMGLVSGAYNVTVTDANACVSIQFGNVNENSLSIASIVSVSNVSCKGQGDGSATAGVTGGGGTFTYSWAPSGGTNITATDLTPGTYTVTITDSLGCQSIATTNPGITEPPPLVITVTKSGASCFGVADGTASAIASGGTPGYTYQWMPGGITGASVSNLSANTYTVTVTDSNNCVQTATIIITEPVQLTSVITSQNNVKCFGGNNGSATVAASGGVPVYNYNWLPSGGNGAVGTSLSAGTYTVTTTDFKGCSTSSSTTITGPPQLLSATSTVTSPSCSGSATGTISIQASGGTPSYSYQWTPAVSSSDAASGLSAGTYTVLVSDSNNCQTNLSVNLSQPTTINGSMVVVNPSCGLSNGSIALQISGGLPPYTYLWSPGGSTNAGLTNLGPGTYNLLVTDAANCTLPLSASLNNASPPVVNIASLNNVSCFGGNDGAAVIAIDQGTAPYSLNWTPSGGNNLSIVSLTAGTYTVNITDATGCQALDSVIITEPLALDVSVLSITDVLCNGESTGAISLNVSGGTGPMYSYAWTPAGSNSATVNGLAIGTYSVTVTDQNNCFKAISATITEPPILSSTIDSIQHPVCFNGVGSAAIFVTGGVFPYTYSWPSSADTTSIANSLNAGSNTVICTDANGCSTSNNVLIIQPLQVVTVGGTNDTLCLGESGQLSATATGGAGNYYYAWQPSGAITTGTLPVTPTSSITYTVVAYDEVGCPGTPATTSAIVFTIDSSSIKAYATTPICPGQNASVYVETIGNTGPLTYQWNNGLGTGTGVYVVTPAQSTTYLVTVSNFCGLSVSDSVTVFINPQPEISIMTDSSIFCVPGTMLFADSSVAGNPNDPITSWIWNFGDGTSSTEQHPAHYYTQAGTYLVSLSVNTSAGCTNNNTSTPLTFTAYASPIAAFSVNDANLELPNEALVISNQSTGAITYNWTFGDGATSTLFNPQHSYSTVGVFQVQLIAMSQEGCFDTVNTEVATDVTIVFPSVFTPDPDGPSGGLYNTSDLHNDIFFPYASGVVDFRLEIFNRWGEKIFESFDIKYGWDGYYRGALCLQNVYVWRAYIKLNDGKEYNKNGNVTLLR